MERSKLLEYSYIFQPGDPTSNLTLLLLHGTGGDELDLLPLAEALAPTAHVISPRGNVSEAGHSRFFERLAEGVFNEADVVRRAGDLGAFVSAARAQHKLVQGKVVAVGYSNGANIAAAMLFLHPEVLVGAVLYRAMQPLSSAPATELHQLVLLASGTRDQVVPEASAVELAGALSARGACVQHEQLNASHALTNEDVTIGRAWLNRNF